HLWRPMVGEEIESGCPFWWSQKGVTRDIPPLSDHTRDHGKRTPLCAINQTDGEVQLPSDLDSFPCKVYSLR
ncbi:MAG: hypothetical protein AAFN70_17000, partial [Planctomycetota bacterium]